MDCDHSTDQSDQNEIASPIAPQPLHLTHSHALENYVAQLRMVPGRCALISENSREALCFGVAGHTAAGGNGIGIAVSSIVSHQLKALKLRWLLRS